MTQDCTTLFSTTYDRANCNIGVVHVGYGAFHRAHQAVFFDDYMELSGDLNWGIAAVNLRSSEAATFAQTARADDGYLLKAISPVGDTHFRLVRPHLSFTDWSVDKAAAEALLACPSVHAVTITVTESGYYLDDEGSLNLDDPIISREITEGAHSSIYAYLARGLELRAKETDHPISILCCDNIRANGQMLERNFLSYLELSNRFDLAEWVRAKAVFPCSMVDRITPSTSEKLENEIDKCFPGRVLSPIHGEAFIQWVLEDKLAVGFPDIGKAGVEVVEDVTPYEEAKIRILNGGHSGLAYLAALAGKTTFDEAMRDPQMRAHFDGWEQQEVLPGLNTDLPFDKYAYLDKVAARFSNAAIADSLERICMDGFSKLPLFVHPTLESCLTQGIVPQFGYDCIASWYVYARRFANGVMPVTYHEPNWESLLPLLATGQEEAFARLPQLWASMPSTFPDFVPSVIASIKKMEKKWPV